MGTNSNYYFPNEFKLSFLTLKWHTKQTKYLRNNKWIRLNLVESTVQLELTNLFFYIHFDNPINVHFNRNYIPGRVKYDVRNIIFT